ncbi:KilA-N domain-containing protein [Mucilaginibacter sp. SP1R1]|uniref:KilA-N domain-containing protein n=1 Tax=Mucilaginibacter sp. SP1R1 TaxID=2723091 RepID=UPI001607E419|nr:KilA-N domain-containing protein [Mucilaginibacter sp. SP1R1]MBB6151653.1 hypothetical protein [Mucilaginibacter sp. SP1R1]
MSDIIINYHDSEIVLFSDERHDYVSITDMSRAFKGPKSIESWMRNKNTINFLGAWERLFNPNFLPLEFEGLLQKAGKKQFNLSIKHWSDTTNAKGIFTRSGSRAGTYAHKDIAMKFASYLSPDFEIFLINEVQRLKKLEDQKNSYELLTHAQILFLVRLKEVFKYVAHQNAVEDANRDVFAATSSAENSFAAFHRWRNKILDIAPQTINDRIKQYCIENHIALTNKMLSKSKNEKILLLDSYESVRNAVWDFLNIQGEINALNLANLVGDMIRTEKGEVRRHNETDLFQEKQNLGELTEFTEVLNNLPKVKTARQVLEYRQKQINANTSKKEVTVLSDFNKNLNTALNYNPKNKE